MTVSLCVCFNLKPRVFASCEKTAWRVKSLVRTCVSKRAKHNEDRFEYVFKNISHCFVLISKRSFSKLKETSWKGCFILPVGPNYITRRSRNATILLAFFFLHCLPLPFPLLLCFICILAILIKSPLSLAFSYAQPTTPHRTCWLIRSRCDEVPHSDTKWLLDLALRSCSLFCILSDTTQCLKKCV